MEVKSVCNRGFITGYIDIVVEDGDKTYNIAVKWYADIDHLIIRDWEIEKIEVLKDGEVIETLQNKEWEKWDNSEKWDNWNEIEEIVADSVYLDPDTCY